MNTWTDADYIKTVQDIAHDAIAEYPDDDDDRTDYVRESVDGSEYVIYYIANEIVLQASQNEPDGAEVRALSADDADWRALRALAAYMAMSADVLAEIDRHATN